MKKIKKWAIIDIDGKIPFCACDIDTCTAIAIYATKSDAEKNSDKKAGDKVVSILIKPEK